MALRNATPLQFSPSGVSDALDSTNVFPGAMAALQNLIPDPSTANLWQCRPAAVAQTLFAPFSNPGFVSVLQVVGNVAYGLIASSRNVGHDEPFAFNLLTNTFATISGVTAANTPASPITTGPWTPPSAAAIATKIVFTHPGFNFGGGFAFGVLDISNPSAPAWTATNTATNALIALPTFVANFNGRAYFLVNPAGVQPAAYFTDVLNPLNITNANQILTFDDDEQLTAAEGLGLYSQLGGVVQSLIIFKNVANVYQITGDAALSNLSRNSLNVATGTLSPNAIASTPQGLAFLAPDGLRMIDFYARVSDPIGVDGNGVNIPFIYNVQPTRAQAASNQNVLRISVQNGNAPGAPNQEWWYDLSRKKWSGPHTFPASMISAWNNSFVMTPIGVFGSLWRSDVVQSTGSVFIENGQQLTFSWLTSLLPDPKVMSYFSMIETVLNLSLVTGQNVVVSAQDQNQSVLGSVIVPAPIGATEWGQFEWGQALWGGSTSGLFPRPLEWKTPIVFWRMQIQATGNCAAGVRVGDLFLRYQKLGYMIVDAASQVLPAGIQLVTEGGIPLVTEGGGDLVSG